MSRAVANIEHCAPDEIRSETSEQNDHEHRQALPKLRRPVPNCFRLDRIPCGQTVSEAGAHNSRKRGDQEPLFETELLDRLPLLLVGDFFFLHDSGGAREGCTGNLRIRAW